MCCAHSERAPRACLVTHAFFEFVVFFEDSSFRETFVHAITRVEFRHTANGPRARALSPSLTHGRRITAHACTMSLSFQLIHSASQRSRLEQSYVSCLIVLVSGVLHPTHARLSLEQRRPDLNLHREPHLGRPRVTQTHQPLRRRDLDHLEGDASWCERRQQRQAAQ